MLLLWIVLAVMHTFMKCVEMNEFAVVYGEFEDDSSLLMNVNVERVDVEIEKGVMKKVVNYIQRKIQVDDNDSVSVNVMNDIDDNVKKDDCHFKMNISKTKRNKIVTKFHKDNSVFNEDNHVV